MAEYAEAERTEEKRIKKENRTNIPDGIKERIEGTSGISLDDVRVHYHSDRPGLFGALAFTQGNQVYMGAGQEKYLPHELGHVVQQKMGMVRATRYENGYAINDDSRLERQADAIGKGNLAFAGNTDRGKYNIRMQYKKMMGIKHNSRIIQKEDGIEKGIIVYCNDLKKTGKIEEEEAASYIVQLDTGEKVNISKDKVFPMYSNTSSSDRVYSSVMEHGVLSPKDRKAKKESGVEVFSSATTDDARAADYDTNDKICVNTLSLNEKKESQDDNTFYNRFCGAYLVALENNDAPKVKLPPVEKCEEDLGTDVRDVVSERDEMLGKIEEEGIKSMIRSGYNQKILARYLEKDTGINRIVRTIFEERLRRTMFIIAPAGEGERAGVESTTKSISPEDFRLVLLPENSYVTTASETVKKVPCIEEELEIPAQRYLTDSEGKAVDFFMKIKVSVPNYREAIKSLPEGKYYSHIVRL